MGLFNFPQVDSDVNVIFCIDGDEYAVEQFKIGFHQPVDGNKNQPEGEVRGGRIMIVLSQTVKSNIYGWYHQAVGKEERGGAVQDRYVRGDI